MSGCGPSGYRVGASHADVDLAATETEALAWSGFARMASHRSSSATTD